MFVRWKKLKVLLDTNFKEKGCVEVDNNCMPLKKSRHLSQGSNSTAKVRNAFSYYSYCYYFGNFGCMNIHFIFIFNSFFLGVMN